MKTVLLVVMILFLCVPSVHASKEGALALSSFFLESKGIGSSGPVLVSGEQDDTGILSMRVEAFGQTYFVPAELLAKLRGTTANGMRLVYCGGMGNISASVYVIFSFGFTSREIQTTALIFGEDSSIEIKHEEHTQ
ncbi:hypothetical protein [Oceanidesulfovibrio marinus]|uniref:hypothetical protein n=1 Tax=Oceanidesulfovibrio marinus TaxID=370038 RepID=UPI0011841032|nr:hypothetical protein [Oceanidesulfovibrio marinus]